MEMSDLQSEWETEKEGYLDNLRDITRETQLYNQIMRVFLKNEEIDRLMGSSRYDEDVDNWILPAVEIPVFNPTIGQVPTPPFSPPWLLFWVRLLI